MRVREEAKPVVAIIQARMSSTRLPGKVMKEICGRPILWHVVNRLKRAELIDKIAVATTTENSDDVIEKWCRANYVPVYRGSLNDVLDRYYRAAKESGANTVVRITSDCPLIEPLLVDGIIEKFSKGEFDHVSVDPSFPDGLDAEVFPFDVLERAHREARLASEREHVTPYIWKNPRKFRLSSIKCETPGLASLRWTVDDEKDFRLVNRIFESLYVPGEVFHMDDILATIRDNPDLLTINSETMRNEGYAKSLREDAVVNL